MKYCFPKSARLRNRYEFLKIFSNSQRYFGQFIIIELGLNNNLCPRLGITVTKKYGNSCKRNRFKRIVREAFRLCRSNLPQGRDFHIRPQKTSYRATSLDISEEIKNLVIAD
jgi:ribonuclease P protein component